MDLEEELEYLNRRIKEINSGSVGIGASTVMYQIQNRKKEILTLLNRAPNTL